MSFDRNDWELLAKIPDLIMRGALIARLGEEQIEVYAPEQDVIVNLNSSGPNLSLEGYSALFDGYRVYVDRKKLAEAKKIWEEFQKEIYKPTHYEIDHSQKYFTMAIMSLIFPFVTHALAFYHLYYGLKKGQKFSKLKLFFSLLLMIPSVFWGWNYLQPIFA